MKQDENIITWYSKDVRWMWISTIAYLIISLLLGWLCHPGFFAMFIASPILIFMFCYETFYLSKCSVSLNKKTILLKRPFHKDVEYPLLEVRWSAVRYAPRGFDIFICRGQQKMMRITDSWDNYDILMTFPHVHKDRIAELELIRRRNERLKMERQYKRLNLR